MKHNKAAEKVSTTTSNYVNRLQAHNAIVTKASDIVQREAFLNSKILAVESSQKQSAAASLAQSQLAATVARANAHNEDVKVKHATAMSNIDGRVANIQESSMTRQNKAEENKKAILTSILMSVGASTREKAERGMQAIAQKEHEVSRLAEDINLKQFAAEENRSAILAQRSTKKAARSPTQKQSPPKDVQSIAFRLEEAQARRDMLLAQRAAKAAPRTPTRDPSPTKLTKEGIQEKLDEASERREAILNQRSSKKVGHGTSPSNSPKKDTALDILERLEDAAARREIHLQVRSEQAGSHANRAMSVGTSVKSSRKNDENSNSPQKILHNDDDALKVFDGNVKYENYNNFEQGVNVDDVTVDVGGSSCSIN